MDKWIDFYEPYFATRGQASEFVERNECLGPSDSRHRAKIIMHQSQRLVSLSDDIPHIRPSRDALQVLFLVICAENVAKLHADFVSEGWSKYYVRQFFETLVPPTDRDLLCAGFSGHDRSGFTLRDVIDVLYEIRCDVVHEGKYWGFSLGDGSTPILGTDPDVVVSVTGSDLRDAVVRGCVRAVENYEPHSN